ncbi:hypothetical protein TNCV_2455061 [Trichonephila clavipes]|nr:hypothetical protein TNCV_2455061 [Trichonephila clavipes]
MRVKRGGLGDKYALIETVKMALQCKSRFGTSINPETVRNVLRKRNYLGRVPQRKPYISKKKKKQIDKLEVNKTTGKTPAELVLGRKLITPFQKLVMVSAGTGFVVGDIEIV